MQFEKKRCMCCEKTKAFKGLFRLRLKWESDEYLVLDGGPAVHNSPYRYISDAGITWDFKHYCSICSISDVCVLYL